MVLADPEDVEPDLLGELDLLQEVAQPLRLACGEAAGRVRRDVGERVEADLHGEILPGRGAARYAVGGGAGGSVAGSADDAAAAARRSSLIFRNSSRSSSPRA